MRCCLVPEERQRNNVTKKLLVIVLPTRTPVPKKGTKWSEPATAGGACQGGSSRAVWITCSRKALTASHIEELDDSEIERLYAHYEARQGAAMTKTLGSAALQLYAGVVSMFLPIPAENQPGLIADLEGDLFVGHALSSATCELYHRYGMFLAPLTIALTTIKHCQFGIRCPAIINDGNQADGGEPAGISGGTALRYSFASGAGTC